MTNRTRLVDFTQPYTESGLIIVAPAREIKSNTWAFLKPFTFQMWCVLGLLFLFVGAAIWIIEHLGRRGRRRPRLQAGYPSQASRRGHWNPFLLLRTLRKRWWKAEDLDSSRGLPLKGLLVTTKDSCSERMTSCSVSSAQGLVDQRGQLGAPLCSYR